MGDILVARVGLADPAVLRARAPQIEQVGTVTEAGHRVGRDPRAMSQAELRAMGHEAMSPMAAIRAHCLDCCAGSSHELSRCMALRCPSWPFRTGKNPWRAPISEERRAELRERAPFASGPGKIQGQNAGTCSADAPVPAPVDASISGV